MNNGWLDYSPSKLRIAFGGLLLRPTLGKPPFQWSLEAFFTEQEYYNTDRCRRNKESTGQKQTMQQAREYTGAVYCLVSGTWKMRLRICPHVFMNAGTNLPCQVKHVPETQTIHALVKHSLTIHDSQHTCSCSKICCMYNIKITWIQQVCCRLSPQQKRRLVWVPNVNTKQGTGHVHVVWVPTAQRCNWDWKQV